MAGLVIKEMFAFVAVDNGDEGVCGASLPGIGFTALVGADMARIDSLRPIARDIAMATGREIKLVKFSVREELGTINPIN